MNKDSSLDIGVAPLTHRSGNKNLNRRQEREAIEAEVVATPINILKEMLKRTQKALEQTTRIDDFTQKLPKLPTDIDDATLQAKLEARQMIVSFLRREEKWLEDRIKRVKHGS